MWFGGVGKGYIRLGELRGGRGRVGGELLR